MKVKRILKIFFLSLLVILVIGYFLPQHFVMPVAGANSKSYDEKSFWFYPWGKSITHKGVDIFGKRGTPVVAATHGLVVYTGVLKSGGNVAVVLGPKWRFHYYAHLQDIRASSFSFVKAGSPIGTVGNTGNAAGKPSHLHYTISSLLPLPWRIDGAKQGWKKMWYPDPIPYLQAAE